ncbi:LPXTG cell wall anchor domain-containing protein [Limosilactobacillus allomucosae]|uniref:LPXTG cell wall anchor domain-containing protein n=1 Tax=Limosilactobacillus allomucosae TaxID=3142938 RepID=A0ABV0I4B7_9LACO
MIVKDKEKTSQPIDTSLHYKMYKDGKHWVTAGITTLMFSGLILGTQTTAHADTAAASTSGDGQAQATTGGNAVTQTTASTASASSTNTDVASQPAANTVSATAAAASTATQSQSAGTITQPVAVNHSQLDQAVAAAKQAGLNPQQQPTTSSTVAPSEVDSAKANIESDYASQAAKLQEATDQQQTINKYNGSKGDSSALDAAVKEAQNTPGLTVKQDQTKTTSLKANDKSGIANWESNTAADYSSQVDAINKAIDAQKQNNAQNANVIDSSSVIQKLSIDHDSGSTVSVTNVVNGTVSDMKDVMFNGADHMGDGYRIVSVDDTKPATFTVTYNNLSKITYNDRKITKVVYEVTLTPNNNQNYDFMVLNDFAYGLALNNDVANLKMRMYYDNGELVDFSDGNAYLSVNSLNNYTNNLKEYSIETTRVNSGGKALALRGSSVTVHDGTTLYSDKANSYTTDGHYAATSDTANKESFELNPNSVTDTNIPVGWDTTNSPYRYYGAGLVKLTGSVLDIDIYAANTGIPAGTAWRNGLWYNTSTIIPVTPTTQINYHYNVVNITPGVPDKDNVSYQYHDLNVATTPEKNWTQGSQVVNGKTEINDDVVSATVKMTTPAASQVEGGMKTLAVTDNYSKFANNVTYQGAQVYENDQLATSLYNVTNNAADATVTATRKDASTTPAGTVSLVVDFKINSDVPSGTKFENSGSGTINNSTVPTNDAEIVTYEQSAEKHWIEGTQTVDGKTYINDDVVTTKVDMSLPDPSTLAHSLTNVTVDDDYSDFQDKVTPQSYRVEENGKDVTSEYNVTYSNGHLTAVRKTPSTAPAGKVSLIATWLINANVASGTKLTNRGSGRINNHTVPTNTPDIKTYTQTADKHWVEGSQTVDDKTYVDGDEVHARVEMSLPDPATLAKPLTDVTLVDNYSDYADKVDYKSAQVLENGKDVTSQYTITNVGGKITAMRKAPGTAPAGTVQLLVNFKVKTGVASGTELNNYGSGRINNNTVATNNAKVVTYQQTTDKHWVDGTQIVDGKTYVDGDTINGQVSMSLPDPATLAKKLTKVAVTDDYSNFKDKVDYQEAHVYENGVDVTSQYNIVNNAGTGTVTATRKDAASAPKGTVVLTATWKVHDDVASGTKLINGGSGTINESTVKTPDRTIETWKQNKPVKHWVEGSQEVDGKVALDNDVISAQVTSDLPNPSDLAHKLSNVQVIDDYSQFKDHVKTSSIRVLENGVDVTSQYTIEDNAGTGIITASRKDPSTTPAGKVQMNVSFQINADTPSGTTFKNTPVSVINKSRVTGQEVTLTTYKQTTDKHWTEGSQVVDDKTYIASDTINARIEMSLPDPSTLTKKLTKVQLVDDYTQLAKYVSAPSDIRVEENGKDVTSEYSIATANGHITATRKDPSTTPAGTVALIAHFKVNADTPSGTKLVNAGSGTLNNETVPTNNPTVKTYTQTTDKHWTEGSQVVDGKVYIDASETHTDVTMSLPDPATLAKKLTKVAITDDYSKFAQYVDYESAQVLENGKDVSSEYTISVADGKVTATRKDASTTPAGTVDLHVNFKLHSDVASGTSLVNSGSGTINDETIATPDRTVKTYKQDTNKTWNVGDQTVNDKLVINNDQVQSTISMTLPDQNTLAKKLTKVQLVDDYSGLSKYADVKTVEIRENGKDVSSEYDVQNDGSHITATRKNAAGAPAGNVQMLVTWQVRADVPSGTQLENKGTGTLDDESVPTPSPKVVTYTPETDKHWVNGSQVVDGKTFIDGDQVSGKVTMSLPDPAQLAQPLSKVAITDDFSNFADKVDYKSAKVLENGKDVTSEYTISVANGKVVATRKNAAAAPKGTLELDVDWTVHTDVPSNTELVNTGSGTIDNDTVPTPKRTIVTYKQDTDKHWVSGGQNVDGKVAINDDNVTAQVNMTLPDKSKLGGSINKVQLTDDFSKFAKDVTVQAVHVYENGIDVTSEYDISIDPNGKVVATRKDPSKVNTAGNGSSTTVTMKANMKAADSLDASSLVAKASGNVNGQTSTTKTSMLLLAPTTDIAVENGQVKSQVNMSLPSDTSEVKNFAITDDYSDFSKYADASEVHVYENGTDATSKYAVTDNDGKVTATRKDMSDAEGGNVTMTVDYKLNHDIPNGTVLENHGSGTLNDETVPTNTPSITTYTQTADKHWVEGTQTVDGKVYIDGTLAHAQVTTSLPDPATLTDKLTDVSITDDYSAFADKVDFQSAQVLENGKDVTSEYTITKQGDKITATRKDPGSAPAGNAQLLLTFKIHSDVPSGTQLENVGSSTINNHTVSTNKATITTFKPDPKKDVVVSVDDNKSLNGANIDLNSSFDYKLEGSTVPKNSTGITEYGFHDDYDQEHDQYNGGYTVLLNSDVTLTDGTVLKKGTDVTKYTTQTIDQDNGIVDIEFDQDFLTKVDYAKSEFGATAYLKMKRVKAGDVENKYVNSINNQAFNSNTVKTHTDEPKPATPKNETPVTPQATTPETPLSPKTSQQPVFAAVQPAALQTASQSQTPSQGQQQLPQTGNDRDEALALTGLASLLFGLGTLGMKKRRRHA